MFACSLWTGFRLDWLLFVTIVVHSDDPGNSLHPYPGDSSVLDLWLTSIPCLLLSGFSLVLVDDFLQELFEKEFI